MANLQFFRENFDKFLEDARIQAESLSNDLKDIPESLQQTVQQVQEQVAHLSENLSAASKDLFTGKLLQKDFRSELQQLVSHLETEMEELYSRIKSAIDKAK
jgi:predicted  nucleic acid-binding Zn-ribbon protein